MKTKLLAVLLLAGSSMVAATHFSIGVGIGGGYPYYYGQRYYSPPPVVYYPPSYAYPGYYPSYSYTYPAYSYYFVRPHSVYVPRHVYVGPASRGRIYYRRR